MATGLYLYFSSFIRFFNEREEREVYMAGFIVKKTWKNNLPKVKLMSDLKRNYIFVFRAFQMYDSKRMDAKSFSDVYRSYGDLEDILTNNARRNGLTTDEINRIRREAMEEAFKSVEN